MTHWLCNWVIGQTFLTGVASFGISTIYLMFGVVSLVAAVYIGQNVPETKGKTFEQIQDEFNK